MAKLDALRASYTFLVQQELLGTSFAAQQLCDATGWKMGTARTYLSKKWPRWVARDAEGWKVEGLTELTETQYLNYMSQVAERQERAFEEELPPKVESLLRKATEAATLALDVYNRPATKFRTEGFSMLMVVAWTALFHAIFEQRGLDYVHKGKDGEPLRIDGEEKAWELGECTRAYFAELTDPVRTNLDFMVRLRNKIEHRFVPALDVHVAGECQAMLLNFEEVLTTTFGERFGLSETLCAPLQPSSYRAPEQSLALKEFQANQYDELRDFLEGYRSSLPDETSADPRFSFRVYLIPKVGNHARSSDLAVEFLKYDPSDSDALRDLQRHIVLTKDRKVPVANQGKYRPRIVIEIVNERLKQTLTVSDHTQAWRAYGVRPSGPAVPDSCDTRFCQYDDAHFDYVYTEEWVDFLTTKFKDPQELARVRRFKPGESGA